MRSQKYQHKQGKYEIDETKDEETLSKYNPVIKVPIYLNLFKCGKNYLMNLDATCEWACMATSKNN